MSETRSPIISHFEIDIPKLSGIEQVMEVSGLEINVPATKVIVAGANGNPIYRQIPGEDISFGDIVIKRAFTTDMILWQWRQEVIDGGVNAARCNGTIRLVGHDQDDIVGEWEFVNGWPSKITGPDLDATQNQIAYEELTIVHEGLTRTR